MISPSVACIRRNSPPAQPRQDSTANSAQQQVGGTVHGPTLIARSRSRLRESQPPVEEKLKKSTTTSRNPNSNPTSPLHEESQLRRLHHGVRLVPLGLGLRRCAGGGGGGAPGALGASVASVSLARAAVPSRRRRRWDALVVCAAPDEEKITRRSPLDFPIVIIPLFPIHRERFYRFMH